MRLTWLIPLLLCAFPEVAQAHPGIWKEHTVVEEPQEKPAAPARPGPFAQRPYALLLHLGVGTPYGLIGASGAYSFIPYLALEAGVGSNAMGTQLAGKLHARFTPAKNGTGFFAAGYSQGRHIQDDGRFQGITGGAGHDDTKYLPRTWSTARWFDVEAGYEHQARDGMNLRVYGGLAMLLNVGAATGAEVPIDQGGYELTKATKVAATLPYVGFSIGHAFDI
jgi:hypothetical protein